MRIKFKTPFVYFFYFALTILNFKKIYIIKEKVATDNFFLSFRTSKRKNENESIRIILLSISRPFISRLREGISQKSTSNKLSPVL